MAVIKGHGTTLSIGSSIAGLTNVSLPSRSANIINASNMESDYEEFVAGLVNLGQFTAEYNDIATYFALDSLVGTEDNNFTITLSDGTSVVTGTCIVESIEGDAAFDGLATGTVTCQVQTVTS